MRNKPILIIQQVMSTTLVACLAGVFAMGHAQAQDNRSSSLEEVIVTGSRLGARMLEIPVSVSVVTEQQLQTQFDVAPDILKALDTTIPGMTVSRGIRGGCDSNIRGRPASFQINGVPVNQDLRASNCNAMYQISPYALQRVEVVRGATAVYGAGAPGGIVNLITRRAHASELEIDGVIRGSVNPGHFSGTGALDIYAGLGRVTGPWDWYGGIAYSDVGAARTPDDEFLPREEFSNWSLNGSTGLDLGAQGQLRITGTYYRENRGDEYAADFDRIGPDGVPVIVPIDKNPFKDDGYDELYSVFASWDVEEVLGHRLAISAYVQNQTYIQRANFFFSTTFGDDFFNSDTENDHWGVRSTLARSFDIDDTRIGLEYGFDFGSARFYRPQIDPVDGSTIVGFVSPEITQHTYSFFAQTDVDFGDFDLVGGARHELYRGDVGDEGFIAGLPGAAVPGDIGHSNLWLLNLGATFDVLPELQVYGGFSQGAELSELGRAARDIPNPGLITPEPATSNQVELGIRGTYGSLAYSAAGFYSWSKKAALLQADPDCAGQSFCPLIPLRARQRFWGMEATADWALTDRILTGAVFTYQRGEIRDETLGRYIDYSTETLSPLRVTAYVEVEPLPGWVTRLQGTYFGAANYFTAAEQGLGLVNTDDLFLADLTSSYPLGPGRLTLGASNLFDNEYVNVTNQSGGPGSFFYYREEGIRLSLGYRLQY